MQHQIMIQYHLLYKIILYHIKVWYISYTLYNSVSFHSLPYRNTCIILYHIIRYKISSHNKIDFHFLQYRIIWFNEISNYFFKISYHMIQHICGFFFFQGSSLKLLGNIHLRTTFTHNENNDDNEKLSFVCNRPLIWVFFTLKNIHQRLIFLVNGH